MAPVTYVRAKVDHLPHPDPNHFESRIKGKGSVVRWGNYYNSTWIVLRCNVLYESKEVAIEFLDYCKERNTTVLYIETLTSLAGVLL